MAEPDVFVLPEVNVGDPRRPRRRRRPTVVAGIDDTPDDAVELAPGLADIDAQANALRSRLGIAPQTPVVAGLEDEATSQAQIDQGLATLRNERGPLAVQRAQGIPLPGAEDSPESTRAILGAIENERTALPSIPRTQLRTPQVAPPPAPRLGVMQPTRPTPVVAGLDDTGENEPQPDTPQGDPTTAQAQGRSSMPAVERSARRIPGVQEDPQDAYDMAQSQQMQRARTGLGIAGIVSALFGDNATRDQRMQALQGAAQANDPNAPLQRMQQRHLQNDEAQRRADDLAFRMENEARRADLDARRIAQAEAATAEHARRTSAEFDVDSQDANGLRDVYDATINSLPEEAQRVLSGWVEFDASNLNARSMASVIDQLNEAITQARAANPRAFRQGQRAGGGRRRGGRLGGIGGGRGVNLGYGVESRSGGAPIVGDAPVDAPQAQPVAPQVAPRAGRPAGARPAAPRAQAPAAPAPGGPAPTGRVLWDRPPTAEEANADPTLDYKESLIQQTARERRLDLNDPRQRRIAAGFVDSMRENTEDAVAARMGQERSQEQQRQVERFVHDYGPVHGREAQLQSLGNSIQRVLSRPNGSEIVRAALHANSSVPAALAAQSREVTELRAQIYDHLNDYFHTYGGANVTDNELMRYYSAFGAGSIAADPAAFLSAISRSRRREQARLDQGAIAFPEGARLYFEERQRARAARQGGR